VRLIKAILFAIVVVLGLSFSTLNSGEVVVDYYLGRRSLPLSIWLVIAFALGVAVASFGCGWRRWSRRRAGQAQRSGDGRGRQARRARVGSGTDA
jgi:uncharacterized integral membrane protein